MHSVSDFRLVPASHVVRERPSIAANPAAGRHDPSMTTFPTLHLMHHVAVQTAHSGKAVLHAVPTPSRRRVPRAQPANVHTRRADRARGHRVAPHAPRRAVNAHTVRNTTALPARPRAVVGNKSLVPRGARPVDQGKGVGAERRLLLADAPPRRCTAQPETRRPPTLLSRWAARSSLSRLSGTLSSIYREF